MLNRAVEGFKCKSGVVPARIHLAAAAMPRLGCYLNDAILGVYILIPRDCL